MRAHPINSAATTLSNHIVTVKHIVFDETQHSRAFTANHVAYHINNMHGGEQKLQANMLTRTRLLRTHDIMVPSQDLNKQASKHLC